MVSPYNNRTAKLYESITRFSVFKAQYLQMLQKQFPASSQGVVPRFLQRMQVQIQEIQSLFMNPMSVNEDMMLEKLSKFDRNLARKTRRLEKSIERGFLSVKSPLPRHSPSKALTPLIDD